MIDIASLPFSVIAAENFVEKLFQDRLPEHLTFHNMVHTRNVTAAVDELCDYENVETPDRETVLLAAVFHDTGYTVKYAGHEAESCIIAEKYLRKMRRSVDEIRVILNCIEATEMPQHPSDFLSKILCDADMAHLAAKDFFAQTDRLRREWRVVKNQEMTDEKWYRSNIEFLDAHRYFTPYARIFWETRKEVNIGRLLQKI